MRLRSVGLLFCMLALAGCHRKAVVIVPPPLPPVGPAVVSVPPPTHPTEPEPAPEVVEVPPVPTPPPTPPKRPVHRRPAPAPPATTATAPAAAPPVELGQLSTGGEANNAALRQGAEDLLRAQQKRLLALPPAVTAAHREQTERASLFLRDADDAWKKLDIEGTRTLATKAKVLLDEITQ